MFEDGIVKVRQRGFDPETSMYCFGGGGGGGGGGSNTDNAYSNQQTGQGSKVNQAGQNTVYDARGNRVNYNTGPAPVAQKTAPDRVLPNGIVVEDYSRPFAGQVNLSSRGTPEVTDFSTQRAPSTPAPVTTVGRGLPIDTMTAVAPSLGGIARPDLGAVSNVMDAINAVTPEQAMQQALSAGQFGDGRMGLGGGFSMGKVPGGFGFQYDTRFAQGGPVTAGIGSLGLPQAMFRSTKS